MESQTFDINNIPTDVVPVGMSYEFYIKYIKSEVK